MANKKSEITIHSSAAEYLTYVASIGDQADSFEMRYENENIWLTQKMIAMLYDVSLQTINEHIKRIYEDGELTEKTTIRKYRIVQTEGSRQVSREVIHYNLQMIIAVGFKVNNERAVCFLKWSGQIVKDYTIQGWTMDKERLKKGHMFTDEYFERQLQNIVKFVCQSVSSIRKLRTYMLQPWTMTKMRRLRGDFSGRCRTKCIGLSIDTQLQN